MIKLINNLTTEVHERSIKLGHWSKRRDCYIEYINLYGKVTSAYEHSVVREAREEEALVDIIIQILDYSGSKQYNLGKVMKRRLKALRRKR